MDALAECDASTLHARAREIYDIRARELHARIDRMFVVLMFAQWAFAVGCALWLTPYTWEGTQRSVHPHVGLAMVLGGVLSLAAWWAARAFPASRFGRHVIALCQMTYSCLLIHLTGGRIETHFHVFGSLAFLAAYRDWTVLVPATVLVALDHFVRGLYWPQAVFGTSVGSQWRWLEHAAWVLFEDLWLVICCREGVKEAMRMAQSSADLERSHTDLEQQTLAAEAASRAKSVFLANMSHEIRTPLNGILGFADLLRSNDDRMTAEERREQLDVVHRSGQHLLSLINDILDLSKIEAGQMEFERIRFSPHQVIADVLSVMRVRASEKSLTLDARWLGRVPATIENDPARLRQLLLNLVGNSIKFTEKGDIQIVARLLGTEEQLQIEVIDTGIGIPPEKREAIFAPFSQADVSVTRKFGGTGLGLSICRHLVAGMGGAISVESTVGQGSAFTVTLATGPLEGVTLLVSPTEALRRTPKPSDRVLTRLDGLRVLIVDDGDTNRKLIKILLTRAGATVDTAENGQICLDKMAESEFDAILMDMQMPVLDGYSATRRLREQGQRLPIIALTAHALKGEEDKCRAAGCDGYLTKPVNRDDLIECVHGMCAAAATPPQPNEPDAACVVAATLADEDLNDPEFRAIAEDFAASLQGMVGDLSQAFHNHDWVDLIGRAHKLKGTAGMVGFPSVGKLARDVETAAQSNDLNSLEELLKELDALSSRLHVPAGALEPSL